MIKSEQELALALEDWFKTHSGVLIAFSGGVDSTLLAYAAKRCLGDQAAAVLADSPSLARREYDEAVAFCGKYKIALHIVKTQEMEDEAYLANEGDRCYYCKRALFEEMEKLYKSMKAQNLAEANWLLCYGANQDDDSDYRPGHRAAKEAKIAAPLRELKMGKEDIRRLCRYYDLEVADKPAMPCLSSRIPHGEVVTTGKLSQIERGEAFLKSLGLVEIRVRHHGVTARLECSPEDMSFLLEHRESISEYFRKELNFSYVSMDLSGFRSGSLNEVLK